MLKKFFKIIILLTVLIAGCKNSDPPSIIDPPIEPPVDTLKTTENKMYVYSNSGNTFYLVDYKTFEVLREIQLPVSDTVYYEGMTISTNRDYLFFGTQGSVKPRTTGYAVYNIKEEKFEETFFTDLKYGNGYFIAAENKNEPGLIYVHFRDYGTYSIDVLQQKIIELISVEHYFVLDKRIYTSIDNSWTIIHKHWSGKTKGSFSEIEFYNAESGLRDLEFTLNKNNKDSIEVYDFELSKDKKLLITYQISDGRSRDIESYFGYYDLETKELYRSTLKFEWSLNPYYTAYSPVRDEIYTLGAYDKFYIINTDTYVIKDTVTLVGKIQGSSQILLSPDEGIAFVACPSSNLIFVIDLNSREVIKTIAIKEPYNMVIP